MYDRCPLRSTRLLYVSSLESSMRLSKKPRKIVWMKKKSKKEMLYPRKRKHLKGLRCSRYSSLVTSSLFSESSLGISEQPCQVGVRDTELGSGTNELVTSGYDSQMSLNASGVNSSSLQIQENKQLLTREIPSEYLVNATHLKEPYFAYNDSNGEFEESPEVSLIDEPEDTREASSVIASIAMDTESQLAINYKQSENPASLTVVNGSMPGASERSDDLLGAAAETCLSPSLADSDSEEQDTESIDDQQTPEARSLNFHSTQNNANQENGDVGAQQLQIPELGPELGVADEVDGNNVVQAPGPISYPSAEEGSFLEDIDVNVYILNRNPLNYDINIRRCRRMQQNGRFPKCLICFNLQAAVENAPCCCICYCIDCAPGMIKCALCYQDI